MRKPFLFSLVAALFIVISPVTVYAAPFVPRGEQPREQIVFCYDSDGGEDFEEAGYVRVISRNGLRFNKRILRDYSAGETTLLERTCNNPPTFTVVHDCSVNGMISRDGACVPDINHAPVLEHIGDRSIRENELLRFDARAADVDNDNLVYSVLNLPDGAIFLDRTFSWTPTYEQAGEYEIVFRVSDGELLDEERVVITVLNVNRPPVLAPVGNRNVNENEELRIELSALDPDLDQLRYFVKNSPAGAVLDGSVFTWTPTFEQSGEYRMTFVASDGSVKDYERVTILVNNVNRPPVLEPIGDQEINEGELLAFDVRYFDPDGDVVIFTVSHFPRGSALVDNEFRWTPDYGQAGEYRIGFSVSDGAPFPLIVVYEEITITVHNDNHAPVFDAIGDQEVAEGQGLRLFISAFDSDGDRLRFSMEDAPAGAELFNDPLGREALFQWTPTYQQAGQYEVTFVADDGESQDREVIRITVLDVNRAPVFENVGGQEVLENELLRFAVQANDPDGGELLYFAVGLPEGAIFDAARRVFEWTPTFEQAGEYTVTFVAVDDLYQTRLAVRIVVENVNRAPELEEIEDQEVVFGDSLRLVLLANDPDGDDLEYSVEPLLEGMAFDGNEFTWTPLDEQIGDHELVFSVSDGDLVARRTFVIRVLQHTTEIGGVIAENTTLTLANSPYLVTRHILVSQGVTLTIEPGVIIKFDGNYYIRVEGTFIADGTEEQRIIFTSNKPNPQPGDWDKIRFMDTSTDWNGVSGSIIRYSTFEYSGGGGQPAYATITVEDASPLIENNDVSQFGVAFVWTTSSNSTIRNNVIQNGVMPRGGGAGYIIAFGDGNGLIANNIIRNNNGGDGQLTGIACDNASPMIENNLIENNSGKGLSGSCSSIIRNNTILNNARGGMYISRRATITNNIISENGQTGVELQGQALNIEFFENIIFGSDIGVDISGGTPIGQFERNTIAGNRNGIRILGNSRVDLYNNNIYNNSEYNFYIHRNGNPIGDINAQDNWWGTSDAGEISNLIYDWNDDFNLARVVFEPFAEEPFEF